jgi:hypothetical protein
MDLEVGGVSSVSTSASPYASVVAEPGPSLAMAAATTEPADLCHPHLFARTAQVVWRLNALFRRHLRHVDGLIARHPSLVAGDTVVWTEVGGGLLQRQFTMTRSADGLTYDFALELAPAGQTPPSWVTAMTGHVTNASAGTIAERTGALHLDYTALDQVLPAEALSGTIDVTFDRVVDPSKPAPGVKRTTEVAFTAFKFGPNDPHGPRTGSFTHVGEPGIGGSIAFQDDVVLLCPANPSALEADTVTHSRWFVADDGLVHGRSDAKATGGQIAAGDTWMGITCHQGARSEDPATATDLAYWMMKLEASDGTTLFSRERAAGAGPACDPLLGATVPSLTDAATDYDFAAAVTFPNAW